MSNWFARLGGAVIAAAGLLMAPSRVQAQDAYGNLPPGYPYGEPGNEHHPDGHDGWPGDHPQNPDPGNGGRGGDAWDGGNGDGGDGGKGTGGGDGGNGGDGAGTGDGGHGGPGGDGASGGSGGEGGTGGDGGGNGGDGGRGGEGVNGPGGDGGDGGRGGGDGDGGSGGHGGDGTSDGGNGGNGGNGGPDGDGYGGDGGDGGEGGSDPIDAGGDGGDGGDGGNGTGEGHGGDGGDGGGTTQGRGGDGGDAGGCSPNGQPGNAGDGGNGTLPGKDGDSLVNFPNFQDYLRQRFSNDHYIACLHGGTWWCASPLWPAAFARADGAIEYTWLADGLSLTNAQTGVSTASGIVTPDSKDADLLLVRIHFTLPGLVPDANTVLNFRYQDVAAMTDLIAGHSVDVTTGVRTAAIYRRRDATGAPFGTMADRFVLETRGVTVERIEFVKADRGDVNADGGVNATDLTVFAGNLGTQVSPNGGFEQGDANTDGVIDGADLVEVVDQLD